MELIIGGEFLLALTHLSLVNSKKDILLDILLDIPRDMYPFSVFGLGWKSLFWRWQLKKKKEAKTWQKFGMKNLKQEDIYKEQLLR